jgi:hypothetical protein
VLEVFNPSRQREDSGRSFKSRRRSSLHVCALLILATLIVAQLVSLKRIGFASSLIQSAPPEMATSRPSPSFTLGPLKWNVRSYVTDPGLAPFRAYYRACCGRMTGITAALRLSNAFASQFAHGTPSMEFVDARYDPATDLQAHTHGEPGHCVTRSGLLATVLLSAGIPARAVQLAPRRGRGHSIVEVWDRRYGWVLVDPTMGGLVGDQNGPCSAAVALRDPSRLRWLGGSETANPAMDPIKYYQGDGAPAFSGGVVYPEPWLYLRSGHRSVNWPFRGRFIYVGSWQWGCGPAQALLRFGILLCGLLAAVCLTALISSVRFPSWRAAVSAPRIPADVEAD